MRIGLSIAMIFCCGISLAVERDEDPKYSAEAEKTAKARHIEIRQELKGLGNHAWAGEYYFGDGLGANISFAVAPKTGYLFEWHGCVGLYDRNYGSVMQDGEHLRLQFTFENDEHGFQGIPKELLSIHWGPRHYLISPGNVVEFCNAVNEGSEPRSNIHGSFLLRQEDEKKPVTGFPNLPQKYRDYLLKKSVQAEIVSVGKYTTRPSIIEFKFKDTPVTLNKGTKDGLLLGMKLIVAKPDDVFEHVVIVKEGADHSEAMMTQMGEEEAGPKVGWRLSTRAPWRTTLSEQPAK